MAHIIDFTQYGKEPDLDVLDRDGLLELLKRVRAQLDQLDEQEPEDMDSEEYEAWGDRHEALEDLADDIRDRLDELGASTSEFLY